MIKTFSTFLLAAFLMFCSTSVRTQQPRKNLTNADVLEMVKAGLPESTIVLAIQQGPSAFDTSPSALIALKNQGISPRILDAMIQAGSAVGSDVQASTPAKEQGNNNNPLSTLPVSAEAGNAGDVLMLDGEKRIQMTRSQLGMRSGGSLKQAVNPFKKFTSQGALKGNHSSLRTNNISPVFEVAISADLNAADFITLVKLKARSDRREIEISRVGITGGSSGFRKEDVIPVSLQEVPAGSDNRTKTYRIKTVNPIPPGKYALALGIGLLYDFGIDSK